LHFFVVAGRMLSAIALVVLVSLPVSADAAPPLPAFKVNVPPPEFEVWANGGASALNFPLQSTQPDDVVAHAEKAAEKAALSTEVFEFVVEYPGWEDCSMAPTDPSAQLDALAGVGQRVPCGEGIQFYVVLVPCPADLNDPACWDPISSAGSDVPLCPGMPFGGCLPAMPTKKGFRTGPVSLPRGKGRYALASVYWANTSSPMSLWISQVDLAQRIPLDFTGTFKLSPYFLPGISGRLSEIKDVSMAQFGQGTVQNIGVYEPPSCVENPASCSKAKVVIVLDGLVPGIPLLTQRADDIIASRRSNSFIIIYVPSSFRRANETSDWPCSRSAMLTPGPCQNASDGGICGPEECDGTYGQNDALFHYIGDTLLPLVSRRFHDAGRGQKAGILGFSYGGLTSCNAAWARPDIFDAAACSSPSMWYPKQSTCGSLHGTYFQSAMAEYPVPSTVKLYVSDGTAEDVSMGGSKNCPGPIALVVQKMRAVGVPDFAFEENSGYQHDGNTAWFANTLWRSLEAIVPYERTVGLLVSIPSGVMV